MKESICERCRQPYIQDYRRLDVCDQCEEIMVEEEKLKEKIYD